MRLFALLTIVPVLWCFLTAVPTLLADGTEEAGEGFKPLAVDTIVSGSTSAYPSRLPTLLVIRDQEDWQRVWNIHHGREAARHQLPGIDFRLFSVIALYAGTGTGVEAIGIVKIGRRDNRLTVSAVEVEPGLGCEASRTVKNAFHMVKVPALEKGVLPSLEIEILARHCPR